jgi:hypothetical protein
MAQENDNELPDYGIHLEKVAEKPKRPKRNASKKVGKEMTVKIPIFGIFTILFLIADASTETGVMTFDCLRINGTTEECKVYFSHRMNLYSVGQSRTIVLKGEANEEVQLHLHLTSEKTSYGLVHQYFTGEYKTSQASYTRCVGSSKKYCGVTPWQCTEFPSNDLSLRESVELPYSWGEATCFVQARSGCGLTPYQGCHYASWAIGSNCSDDLYSLQTPTFSATVNINGIDYKVGSQNQLDDFKVDLIGSYQGSMCQPGTSFQHVLQSSGKYYFVSASNANVGVPGQIGELQCDNSHKIARFYAKPTLDQNAQDGHFYSFQQQAYQLQKAWKILPFRESHCLWNIEGPNLVGYSQSGSAIEIEISSFGKFSILKQNVLCEPKIKNMWLEGCNNCSSGRLICLTVNNQWGSCSSQLTTNFETSWNRLNVGTEEQDFCIDVKNDTISDVEICLDKECNKAKVSWELEDLIEAQNSSKTDFKGKSIKWKSQATIGFSSVLVILVLGVTIYIIVQILQTRKIKVQ